MKHYLSIAALACLVLAPLAAQAPAGWKVRADRSTSASDPDAAGTIKFVTMGTGFHATNPQAAVYWNPANSATGNYTVKGNFVLQKPSGHTNYYGLVFGGADLDNAKQTYMYFLVAQDGTWIVKKREGDANAINVSKGADDVVKKPDASGKSTNMLEVRVAGDKIDYVVNGKVVHSAPKAGVKTDGTYGIRVNHLLEVHIDGFGKS